MTIDFKNKIIEIDSDESLESVMNILDRLEYEDIKDFKIRPKVVEKSEAYKVIEEKLTKGFPKPATFIPYTPSYFPPTTLGDPYKVTHTITGLEPIIICKTNKL